jgi:hypothetical protein
MNKDQKKQLSREKRRLQREKRARLEKDIDEIIEAELDIESDEYELEEPVAEIPEVIPDVVESPVEKETLADVDALVLEVTQARDKRIMNSSEGIKGMVSKTIRSAADKLGIDMPPEKDTNAVQIEKDANGDWRAIMWVSNNFKDRDGDIICEDAHKEYVEWVKKNMDLMPASLSWHIPESIRENPVDYIDYFDGFLVASVKLTESEAASLLEVSKEVNLGMSHGSFALARDPNDPRIITKYRMYEVSDLPLKNAANPFTDLETISKEVGMDKIEYLSKIIGADKAKAYLERIGLKKQALLDAEIENKELTGEPIEKMDVENMTESEMRAKMKAMGMDSEGMSMAEMKKKLMGSVKKSADEPEAEVTPVTEPVVKDANAQNDLIAQVLKALDIEGLNAFVTKTQTAMEKVEALEELVKELSANQDEKLAEMIAPPITKQLSWARPSEDKGNVIKKDDKLTKQVPGLPEGFWLSEATGTVPIKEETA